MASSDKTPLRVPYSVAMRCAQLMDLYAPEVEQPDGSFVRDPSAGVISLDDFMRLLKHEATPPTSEGQ